MPTAEPEKTPAATPPVPSEPDATELRRAPFAEELRLVIARGMDLIGVTQRIAAQAANHPGILIRTKGIERILNGEEQEQLDTLPLEERLFAELYLLGFEEAIQDACNEGRVQLSDSALALIGRVSKRLDGLSGDERTQAEQARYLPRDVEDGPASVTVRLTVGEGSIRYEEVFEYGREGSKWILRSIGNE